MNLKNFHIFFVSASVILAAWFGGFCLGETGDMMGSYSKPFGIVSLVFAVAMVFYGIRTFRKLNSLVQES